MEASPVQRGGSSGQLGPPSASLRPEAFTHVELSRGCYLGPWGGEATVLCQPKPKEQSKPKGSKPSGQKSSFGNECQLQGWGVPSSSLESRGL